MIGKFKKTAFLLLILATSFSKASLVFDSEANKIQLYGPYIKYNILKPPYSLGRFQFAPKDITLEVETSGTKESPRMFVLWPRFLLDFGRVEIRSMNGEDLFSGSFSSSELGSDEKYARLHLEGEAQDLLDQLKVPFQICVKQSFESSFVKGCSDQLIYIEGTVQSAFKKKNATLAKFNGKKSPKNAQITLSPDMKTVKLSLKFKSGFSLYIRDKVHNFELKNLAIDPKEKRIGVLFGDGSVRPVRLTIKDHFFSFIKENNYFKNQYTASADWPQDLEHAEMEFAPYQTGSSLQLYGMILPQIPPPSTIQLSEDNPNATYSNRIELKGSKQPNDELAAKVENELFIHNNNREFLWNFPADKRGAVNQNYLSLQHEGKNYFFSERIFRAHQTNISAAAAISTSQVLDIVPGFNLNADHWFEELWNKSSLSFQRWGVAANFYNTLGGFKPNKEFEGKINVLPMNFDVMFRFTPGVRPVQSSFGLGMRYLNFTLYRSVGTDLQTQMIGFGGFWHTAPQKIIDDVFNTVPFFRYPKWMEISFYYYPLLLGPEEAGFSFSWQARGKLFFARHWYLDASFNVNAISFKKTTFNGIRNITDSFNIGTAHGTIGLGYIF